ncbi:outer membrane protein [Helicobacter cetorum]|uniref:outer membrane protein n=1 Tax=Helicobacter cetorum TaxID=138563 RepID=UPI000CF08DA3|nr:outer membrane protein [Helicobacter cetorum]
MILNTYQQNRNKIKIFSQSLALSTLLSSMLVAEDNGFYASIGYQIGQAQQKVNNKSSVITQKIISEMQNDANYIANNNNGVLNSLSNSILNAFFNALSNTNAIASCANGQIDCSNNQAGVIKTIQKRLEADSNTQKAYYSSLNLQNLATQLIATIGQSSWNKAHTYNPLVDIMKLSSANLNSMVKNSISLFPNIDNLNPQSSMNQVQKDYNALKVFVDKANLLNNALEKPLMDSYLNELNNIASETHSQEAINSLKNIQEQFQGINALINEQASSGGCSYSNNPPYFATANSTNNLGTGCNQTLAINVLSSDLQKKLETLQNTLANDLKHLADVPNNSAKNAYAQILETMKNQVGGILNANTLSNLMVYLNGINNASGYGQQQNILTPNSLDNQITNAINSSSGAKIAANEQDAITETLNALEKFQQQNPNYDFNGNTTLQKLFDTQDKGSIYYQLKNQGQLLTNTLNNAYNTINTTYTSPNGLESILNNQNLMYSINQAITANTLKQLGVTNYTNFTDYTKAFINNLQQASTNPNSGITTQALTTEMNNMIRLVQLMINSDSSGYLKDYTSSLDNLITELQNAQSQLNNTSMNSVINNILQTISNQTSSVQVFSQNLSQLLASKNNTDLSQLQSFIKEINQKMTNLENSIQSHTDTRAFYQYNAGVSKQQGIANGIGVSIGYKQFFGKQRFFGIRYYGFFDYNHASIGVTSNQVATNIYTYGVGTDLLYNFFRRTFVSKAINVGIFGGIQIAGNTWESSLDNQIKSQWGSKTINPTNFQFLFNLGFRTNFASLISQASSKKFLRGRLLQQGIEFGVKIPTINQQYLKSHSADLEYRRLYSFYVNYVVGF